MAVTRKPNPAYLTCFSRLSLLKEPSLSVDVLRDRIFCLCSELLYNLTADVDKRQKSQPSRVYFTQSGSQISQMSRQLSLDINREECQRYTAYVKVRLDCLVLTLAVFVLGCPSAALSHDLEHPHFAMLTCDMTYLLMSSVFLSYLFMQFLGQSIKVRMFPTKMFRQIKTREKLKCQDKVGPITFLIVV